jgi:hypothetical protein
MSKSHALPTGLGIENEGLELELDQLPEWEESKIKTYPIVSPRSPARNTPLMGSAGKTQ